MKETGEMSLIRRQSIPNGRTVASVLASVLAVALLSGCDWFGKKKETLTGDRVSVLIHERALKADVDADKLNILLPEPVPNEDWPQAGGVPNHAMHHVLVNDQLRRAWSVSAGKGASDYERLVASPIVADGRVYVVDARSRVTALDAKTGREVWRKALTPKGEEDGHVSGGAAIAYGKVYVTAGFAQVIALKAEDGSEVWRQPMPAPMRTAPTVRGGRVFVTTVDNQVFALETETGKEIWNHSGITESASILGGGSPAVDGDVVVVPFSSGELIALRAANGRVLWSDSLAAARRTDQVSTLSHIRGRPVIDRGRVFALSHGGIMVAIDLRSGRRLWERQIGGLESPWVAGDYLYVLTSESEIACLARDDGRILWVEGLPRYRDEKKKKGPITWAGPVLASDRLIIAGSHGQALTVSPYTGEIIGAEKMPDGVTVAPVIASGSIYFLAKDADLVAYR